jgi:hypothetical protein
MARPFSPATAEQVVAVVEAVVVADRPATPQYVAEFSDLTPNQAEAALKLAADVGLLSHSGGKYSKANPLCRFLTTPHLMRKAAVLRLLLESYEPFIVFRERLAATKDVSAAAKQTKAALDLDAHREEVKDTLISLGTYSQALTTQGGGHYGPAEDEAEHPLDAMVHACADMTASEARIRQQLGAAAAAVVSRDHVLLPLADALLKAQENDGRGAVVAAGNAVESYLEEYATRRTVQLGHAPGINAKIDKLVPGNVIPKKLATVGKYLGHVRNAADHGVDTEVGAPWTIRPATGVEYVFVSCSFIAAVTAREQNKPPEI